MYVAQSICIWDSVWQARVSQIIYYSELLAAPFPPPRYSGAILAQVSGLLLLAISSSATYLLLLAL